MPPRSAPLPGPAPGAKSARFGAGGNCGGGAGCCCAMTLDDTPSANAAAMKTFDLLIDVASLLDCTLWLCSRISGTQERPDGSRVAGRSKPRKREHRGAGLYSFCVTNTA